jgi:hypothetical protein
MKSTIIFLVLSFTTRIGFACSCDSYEPNFYKNISESSFICMAVFSTMDFGYEYEGAYAETGYFILIDTIGNFGSQIGDTIVVTGQDGFNCGATLDNFAQGDTAFLSLSDGFWESFVQDTFYLDGCSNNILKIKNDQNSHLSIDEIKDKITRVLEKKEFSCWCSGFYWEPNEFYDKVSIETSNCLAVFNRFDYAYEYDGLHSQTGYFTLIDTIGNFNSQIGDAIIVIGEDGINCGEMLNRFSSGDTLFLALSDGYYDNFVKDTFYLKGGKCGNFHLKVTNGQNDDLSISDIKNKIKSVLNSIEPNHLDIDLKMYPNPTGGVFAISVIGTRILGLQIIDLSGKLILEFDNLNANYFENNISNLHDGLYNIKILTDKGLIDKSLIKE